MPLEVTAYRAEDGSLHTDACEAATKDLELLIAQSPLAENQPYCRKVLEWLISDSDTIMDKLKEYHVACPKTAREETVQEKPGGPAVTIPSGVYWSVENDNFYSSSNGTGMGDEFFRRWVSRCLEFPQTREEAVSGD